MVAWIQKHKQVKKRNEPQDHSELFFPPIKLTSPFNKVLRHKDPNRLARKARSPLQRDKKLENKQTPAFCSEASLPADLFRLDMIFLEKMILRYIM